MDLRLIARDGVFSTADAARLGLDRNALGRLVRDGRCTRLDTGWYAVVDGERPTGEPLHRLRALALGRALCDRAALSHHSRLLLAGVPVFAADLATVHLTALVEARGGVSVGRRGVSVHRKVADLHLPGPPMGSGVGEAQARSPLCVPVTWACVQVGLLGGPEAFVVSSDAALRREIVAAADLAAAVELFNGHTGIGPVRAALGVVDGRHESPGESRTAFVLTALGYTLEPQLEVVAEGRLYRPDFRIAGTRVLVEFDGAVKYEDRRALYEEKQREDALRRTGWVVVRLVWADLADPSRVARRIAAALATPAT